MTRLFNEHVQTSPSIAWHTERDITFVQRYLKSAIDQGYPVKVAEIEDTKEPVAFAALNSMAWSLDSWRYTAELTTHVSVRVRRRGIASALWQALRNDEKTERKRLFCIVGAFSTPPRQSLPYSVLLAYATADDHAAMPFLRKCGFVNPITSPRLFCKLGAWRDQAAHQCFLRPKSEYMEEAGLLGTSC